MFKRTIVAAVAASLIVAGCGTPLDVGDKTYPTYGLFNQHSSRSDKVCYETSVGNVIWGVLLVETLIAPIYFFGFSLYNPVRLKSGPNDDCSYDD